MTKLLNASGLIGTHDVLFMTIDTLRFDVACDALEQGETPNLAALMPQGAWEERHSPGNFTYAAHHAFFAGFLPTPVGQGPHPRLFATRFAGSESIAETTCVFDTPDIVSGFAGAGYKTICIGGVGFFSKRTPLSCVLPSLFMESYWREDLGVTCHSSTENQVELALQRIAETPAGTRIFLFINISACHQPNLYYLPGAQTDSPESQRAALSYVDRQLPPLISAMQIRAPLLIIVCSDHGTAYGDDGYYGHRLAHKVVWTVPYFEATLPQLGAEAA